MQTNETPHYDASVNTTGCCPKFNPGGWDDQELHFRNKPFVRATTRSVMHVPVNMGGVFARVNQHIDAAGASAGGQFVLSRDSLPLGKRTSFFTLQSRSRGRNDHTERRLSDGGVRRPV
ncbi:hydrolase [Mesorhizobium silamurunense]|uniref:hydrolase n=1 Tax=Mesorhizobium silamurunense TaxID=499528 RepID=UPI001AEE1BF6|nr:hydrolase [Mesorhizobium silamurunense]